MAAMFGFVFYITLVINLLLYGGFGLIEIFYPYELLKAWDVPPPLSNDPRSGSPGYLPVYWCQLMGCHDCGTFALFMYAWITGKVAPAQ